MFIHVYFKCTAIVYQMATYILILYYPWYITAQIINKNRHTVDMNAKVYL